MGFVEVSLDGVSRLATRLRLRVGVAIGLAAFVVCLYSDGLYWHGLPPFALGLAIRLWGAGHLVRDKILTLSGPYRYVRHPLYLGTLIAFLGVPLILHSVWLLLAVLFVFAPCYYWQMISEEEKLERMFGEAYREYRRHVPALFPRPWRPWPAATEQRFSWHRAFVTNRWQYQLLYAVLALLLMDVTEDVGHAVLVHHQSFAAGLAHLRDIADSWRTGRF